MKNAVTIDHPLVGAGVHWTNPNRVVLYQGMILAVLGKEQDLALIQWFDWIVGHGSTRRLVPLSEIASSDQWVLYESVDQMNDHYERIDKYRKEPKHSAYEDHIMAVRDDSEGFKSGIIRVMDTAYIIVEWFRSRGEKISNADLALFTKMVIDDAELVVRKREAEHADEPL